jgi:hypothetical protein
VGHGDGPSRSSVEVPVMGMERMVRSPGLIVCQPELGGAGKTIKSLG